ncbi:MAG: secretin N-terminal domain-containing protein, partial [Planctomycetota bacterium]
MTLPTSQRGHLCLFIGLAVALTCCTALGQDTPAKPGPATTPVQQKPEISPESQEALKKLQELSERLKRQDAAASKPGPAGQAPTTQQPARATQPQAGSPTQPAGTPTPATRKAIEELRARAMASTQGAHAPTQPQAAPQAAPQPQTQPPQPAQAQPLQPARTPPPQAPVMSEEPAPAAEEDDLIGPPPSMANTPGPNEGAVVTPPGTTHAVPAEYGKLRQMRDRRVTPDATTQPGEGLDWFAFKNTPWEQVLQAFIDRLGKPLLGEMPVIGEELTYTPIRTFTKEEALDELNLLLQDKGFRFVELPEHVRIVAHSEMREYVPVSATYPTIESFEAANPRDGDFVVVYYLIEDQPAQMYIELLQGAVMNADMKVVKDTNQIEIAATARDIRRFLALKALVSIDPKDPRKMKIFDIKTNALDIEQRVRAFLDLRPPSPMPQFNITRDPRTGQVVTTPAKQGASELETRMVADERTNTIIVQATQDKIEEIEKLIEFLDQRPDAGFQTWVREIQHADAAEVAELLNQIFQQEQGQAVQRTPNWQLQQQIQRQMMMRGRMQQYPGGYPGQPGYNPYQPYNPYMQQFQAGSGIELLNAEGLFERAKKTVRMVAHPRSNSLIIYATEDGLKRVDDMLEIIDQPARDAYTVIPVKHARVADIAPLLNEIVQGIAQGPTQMTRQPVIVPDEANKQFYVMAERDDLERITALIQQLDVPAPQQNRHLVELTRFAPSEITPIVIGIIEGTGGQQQQQGYVPPAFRGRFGRMGQPGMMPRQAPTVSRGKDYQVIPLDQAGLLIVVCTDEDWARVEPQIKELDGAARSNLPRLATFTITKANAQSIAQTLSMFYRMYQHPVFGASSVTIQADGDKVLVYGIDPAIEEIGALIATLDVENLRDKVEILPLVNADATTVAQNAQLLFVQQRGRFGGVGPVIQAEPITNSLIVQAEKADLERIKDFAQRMDESVGQQAPERKFVNLRNAQPAEVATAIQSAFSGGPSGRGVGQRGVVLGGQIKAFAAGTQLVVEAPAEKMPEILAFIEEVDNPKGKEILIQTVKLPGADVNAIAQKLNAAFQTKRNLTVRFDPDPASETILLTCSRDALEEAKALIQEYEEAYRPLSKTVEFHQMQYATAAEAAQWLQAQLVASMREQVGRNAADQIRVVADARTNRLIISGPLVAVEMGKALLAQYDVAPDKPQEPPLHTFVRKLPGLDVANLARTLESTFRSQKRADGLAPAFTADVVTEALIVAAPKDMLESINGLIDTFSKDAENLVPEQRFFALQHAEANYAVGILQPVLREQAIKRYGTHVAGRISIVPDTRQNTVIISAPHLVMAPAEELLKQIDVPDPEAAPVTIALEHADPSQVAQMILTMFRPSGNRNQQADVSAVVSNGQLVVKAPANKLEQIKALAKAVDAPGDIGVQVRMFELKVLNAVQVQLAVQGFLTQLKKNVKPGQLAPNAFAEPTTNTLVVLAPPDVLPMIEMLVQELEGKSPPSGNVQAYQLNYARASEIATQVDQMLKAKVAEREGVKQNVLRTAVFADQSGNRLFVYAPDDYQKLAAELVKVVDAETTTGEIIHIVPLDNGDASQMAQSLNAALQQAGGPKSGAARVRIAADMSSNALILAGLPNDVAAAEKLIEGIEQNSIRIPEVKTFPIRFQSVSMIADTVKNMFGGRGGGPQDAISVVTDEYDSRLIVTANRRKMVQIETIIGELDKETPADEDSGRIIRFVDIYRGDASDIVWDLEEFLRPPEKDGPDVSSDWYGQYIIVKCRPSEFPEIERLIRELEQRQRVEKKVVIKQLKGPNRDRILEYVRNRDPNAVEMIQVESETPDTLWMPLHSPNEEPLWKQRERERKEREEKGQPSGPAGVTPAGNGRGAARGQPQQDRELHRELYLEHSFAVSDELLDDIEADVFGTPATEKSATAPAPSRAWWARLAAAAGNGAAPAAALAVQERPQSAPASQIAAPAATQPAQAPPSVPPQPSAPAAAAPAQAQPPALPAAAPAPPLARPAVEPQSPPPPAAPAVQVVKPAAPPQSPAPAATPPAVTPSAAPSAVQPHALSQLPPMRNGTPTTQPLQREKVRILVQPNGTLIIEGPEDEVKDVERAMEVFEEDIKIGEVIRIFPFEYGDVNAAAEILVAMFNERPQIVLQQPQQPQQQQQQRGQRQGDEGRQQNLMQQMQAVIGRQQQQGGRGQQQGGQRLRVVPDPGHNFLIVKCDESDLPDIIQLLRELDMPPQDLDLRLIQLKNLVAEETAQTIMEGLGITKAKQPRGTRGMARTPQQPGQPGAQLQLIEMLQAQFNVPGLEGGSAKAERVEIVPNASTNSLLVSAPPDMMKIIVDVIEQLEGLEGRNITGIFRYPLEFAQLEDILPLLQDIFSAAAGAPTPGGGAGGPGGGRIMRTGGASAAASGSPAALGPVTLWGDPRTNTVVFTAMAKDRAAVEQQIKLFDIEERIADAEKYVCVFGDATAIADTVQALYRVEFVGQTGGPGRAGRRGAGEGVATSEVRIVADAATNTIWVWGPVDRRGQILRRIKDIDEMNPGRQIANIPVRNVAPSEIVSFLWQFMDAAEAQAGRPGRQGQAAPEQNPPQMVPNDAAGVLVVRGSQRQLREITELVEKFDDKTIVTTTVDLLEIPLGMDLAELASEVERVVNANEEESASRANRQPRRLVVGTNVATNHLILAGDPTLFGTAKSLVTTLSNSFGDEDYVTEIILLTNLSAQDAEQVITDVQRQTGGATGGGARRSSGAGTSPGGSTPRRAPGTGQRGGMRRGSGGGSSGGGQPATPPAIQRPANRPNRPSGPAAQPPTRGPAGGGNRTPARSGGGRSTSAITPGPSSDLTALCVAPASYVAPFIASGPLTAELGAVIRFASDEQVVDEPTDEEQIVDDPNDEPVPDEPVEEEPLQEMEQDQPPATEPVTQPAEGEQPQAGLTGVRGMLRSEVIATPLDSQRIIIRGRKDDVNFIKNLLAMMEQSTPQPQVKVIPLEYAKATALQPIIDKVVQSWRETRTDQPGRQDRFSINAEARSNSLIVAAAPAIMEQIVELVHTLDVEKTGQFTDVRSIPLQHIRAIEAVNALAPTIEKLNKMRDIPTESQATLEAVERNNSVLVLGIPRDIEEIERLLKTLDVELTQDAPGAEFVTANVQLIPVRNGQADDIAKTMTDMIEKEQEAGLATTGGAGGAKPGKPFAKLLRVTLPDGTALPPLNLERPIKVIPEGGTNSLIVFSTTDNNEALHALVSYFDTLPIGPETDVKAIALKYASAEAVAKLIEDTFKEKGVLKRPSEGVGGTGGGTIEKGVLPPVPPGVAGQGLPYPLVVTHELRTNTIVLVGRKEAVLLAAGLIHELDKPSIELAMRPHVLTLKNISAGTLAERVTKWLEERSKALGGKNEARDSAVVQADERSNSLIVLATDDMFGLIENLAKQLDDAPRNSTVEMRFLHLEYADAVKLQNLLTESFKNKATADKAITKDSTDSLDVLADTHSNSLLLVGTRDYLAEAERIAREFDRPGGDGTVNFAVLKIKFNSAANIAAQLQDFVDKALTQKDTKLSGTPIHVTSDPLADTLLIAASREDMAILEHWVQLVDRPADLRSRTLIVTLQQSLAEDMAKQVEALFKAGGGGAAGGKSDIELTATADKTTNSLVIFGPPALLPEIADFIRRVDSAEGPSSIVRIFKLEQAAAQDAGDLLQRVLELR